MSCQTVLPLWNDRRISPGGQPQLPLGYSSPVALPGGSTERGRQCDSYAGCQERAESRRGAKPPLADTSNHDRAIAVFRTASRLSLGELTGLETKNSSEEVLPQEQTPMGFSSAKDNQPLSRGLRRAGVPTAHLLRLRRHFIRSSGRCPSRVLRGVPV